MEVLETLICCGCLSTDRKMRLLQDYLKKRSFLEIINYQHVQVIEVSSEAIWLCWVCEALLKKFSHFNEQVRNAYWSLHNRYQQAANWQCRPQLTTKHLYSLQYSPDTEEWIEIGCNVVDNTCSNFKEECDVDEQSDKSDRTCIVTDDNVDNELCSDDDDKFLINFSTTKTKRNQRRKITKRNTEEKTNCAEKKHKKKVKELKVVQKEICKEIELNRDEIDEERRCMVMREEYVNSMLRCERCIISFPNIDDLKDHIAIKHDASAPYKCDICECVFASEVSYNYHTNKHKRRFECIVCMERFASRRAAEKHYDTVHCHRANYNYEELSKKMQENGNSNDMNGSNDSVHESTMFPCDRCSKSFRWKTSLRKHAETHSIAAGDKRRPYCEPCSMSFTTTANLQKHVKTSSNHQIQLKLRKLKETLPSEAATPEKQKARLDQIKSAVITQRQQFNCGQCDRKFQWRGNLLRHMQSHAARAAGELVCHPCNRTFSSIATYQQHMNISKKHVSEEQFKYSCDECNKRFVNKTRLSDHVAWDHLKEYVHVCHQCQKVFKSHTSLYLHMQVVHRKDKAEHLCDHCGKPFPNHAKLRSHITALHSGDTPYKCLVCGARFSWHSCLSRHVRRTHRSDKKGTT